MATATMKAKVVPAAEWLEARKALLQKEKEFTRLRDELSALRREMPWQKVEKEYVFEGPQGKVTLAEMFSGKSQLMVYHFMLAPGWEAGCPMCSYLADNFDGMRVHLEQRDVAFTVVSRGTMPEIAAFQKRMGWKFPWVSSYGTDFNYDYKVAFREEDRQPGKKSYNYGTMAFPMEEGPGLSVFYKDADGQIFHTYSTYARGLDSLLTAYNFLDLTPKGRDEEDMKPHKMAWVRHHDRYESTGEKAACCSGGGEKSRKMLEPVLGEYQAEVAITRRILEKVPADKLTWTPHDKSMTLGQLALHIAQIPDRVSALAMLDGFDAQKANFVAAQPKDLSEVMTTFESGVVEGEQRLRALTDESAMQPWTMKAGQRTAFVMPRIGIVRTIMLNHWYHHRGQLSVYLRLLDIPVPVVYGRSADENPFQ